MARGKTANAMDPKRIAILRLLEERGPLTQSQLAKLLSMGWGALQWHLYVLEREGKIRRAVSNGLVLYSISSRASR